MGEVTVIIESISAAKDPCESPLRPIKREEIPKPSASPDEVFPLLMPLTKPGRLFHCCVFILFFFLNGAGLGRGESQRHRHACVNVKTGITKNDENSVLP